MVELDSTASEVEMDLGGVWVEIIWIKTHHSHCISADYVPISPFCNFSIVSSSQSETIQPYDVILGEGLAKISLPCSLLLSIYW